MYRADLRFPFGPFLYGLLRTYIRVLLYRIPLGIQPVYPSLGIQPVSFQDTTRIPLGIQLLYRIPLGIQLLYRIPLGIQLLYRIPLGIQPVYPSLGIQPVSFQDTTRILPGYNPKPSFNGR